jgi:NAD(P)-dependent dehydrogenase (short-subunit alcohol dehydrogenase family)
MDLWTAEMLQSGHEIDTPGQQQDPWVLGGVAAPRHQMNNAPTGPIARGPELLGQTIVIGAGAGIGLETARRARAEGANVILTARHAEPLQRASIELGAVSTAAFDATDPGALERFFEELPPVVDHVLVTAGAPRYGRLLEINVEQARLAVSEHILQALWVARNAARKVRPGGTLLLMSGTGGRRIGVGLGLVSAVTAAMPPLTASLALELAPVRVNLIAPGFVDTPLSASLLGDGLETRRAQLRATLPIGRVVGAADVAALAVHLMTNTARSPARPSTSTADSNSSLHSEPRQDRSGSISTVSGGAILRSYGQVRAE